jgi:hypothetical protein
VRPEVVPKRQVVLEADVVAPAQIQMVLGQPLRTTGAASGSFVTGENASSATARVLAKSSDRKFCDTEFHPAGIQQNALQQDRTPRSTREKQRVGSANYRERYGRSDDSQESVKNRALLLITQRSRVQIPPPPPHFFPDKH